MKNLCIAVCALTLVLVGSPRVAAAKKVTLKVATLAPEGSTWWKLMKKASKRVKELSDGRIKIRLYAGGVAGDEPDFVRKMRVGQIHGAAVTSVGLAEIQPAMLVLQAPGLFESWDELDHVRSTMKDKFTALLADKGYVPLLWGDVGFSRLFSKKPIRLPAGLKGTRPWCWTQDGVFKAYFETIGAKPVLVGVPEVLPGLQTGLLDSFVTAPLAAVALQWFSRTTHMLDLPVNVTIGAVVLSKKKLDTLSPEDLAVIRQVGEELSPELAEAVRADNHRAIEAIRKAGITVSEASADEKAEWAKVATAAADAAAGPVYPKDLLAEVREVIRAHRQKAAK